MQVTPRQEQHTAEVQRAGLFHHLGYRKPETYTAKLILAGTESTQA